MTSTHPTRQAPSGIERSSRALEDPAGFLLDIARGLLLIITVVGGLISLGPVVWKYASPEGLAASTALDGGIVLLAVGYAVWCVLRESKNG